MELKVFASNLTTKRVKSRRLFKGVRFLEKVLNGIDTGLEKRKNVSS